LEVSYAHLRRDYYWHRTVWTGPGRGADVCAITDNDETSHKHGNIVTTKLDGVAKRLRVLYVAALWPQCPAKGDISNWIEQTNGTAEQFYALIAQAKLEPKSEPDLDPEDHLVELNRGNCVVLDGGKAWVLRFEQVAHKINDRRYSYWVPVYLRIGGFKTLYMNRRINNGERWVELGQWWLKNPARRQYFGVVFEPGREQILDGKLNLWTGWGIEPKRGDWSLMRQHPRGVGGGRRERQ
jgi:hypothetical protein